MDNEQNPLLGRVWKIAKKPPKDISIQIEDSEPNCWQKCTSNCKSCYKSLCNCCHGCKTCTRRFCTPVRCVASVFGITSLVLIIIGVCLIVTAPTEICNGSSYRLLGTVIQVQPNRLIIEFIVDSRVHRLGVQCEPDGPTNPEYCEKNGHVGNLVTIYKPCYEPTDDAGQPLPVTYSITPKTQKQPAMMAIGIFLIITGSIFFIATIVTSCKYYVR